MHKITKCKPSLYFCFILLVLYLTSTFGRSLPASIKTSSPSLACAYCHDHTIQGMLIPSTLSSSLASHLTLVISWSSRQLKPRDYRHHVVGASHFSQLEHEPTWSKFHSHKSFIQGMSVPHRYHTNIPDQYHLTISCSAALPPSGSLLDSEAHKSQVLYPDLILHPLPCLMLSSLGNHTLSNTALPLQVQSNKSHFFNAQIQLVFSHCALPTHDFAHSFVPFIITTIAITKLRVINNGGVRRTENGWIFTKGQRVVAW